MSLGLKLRLLRVTFSVLGKVPTGSSPCACVTCWPQKFRSQTEPRNDRNIQEGCLACKQILSQNPEIWLTWKWTEDATRTGNGRSPDARTCSWITASLGLASEERFRPTPPCAHLSLSLEANAGSSLAAPSPLLTLLWNQPVDSSSSPASVPPLVKPQEMPTEHMLVAHPALRSAFPFSTSGSFSPPPEAWKQPGQTRPFARHSHHIPTAIPWG